MFTLHMYHNVVLVVVLPSVVVLDGYVLAADEHVVVVEPVEAELVAGADGSVDPLDGEAVVVGRLAVGGRPVAGDGQHDGVSRLQHSVGRLHLHPLQSARALDLGGEPDLAVARVGHTQSALVVRSVGVDSVMREPNL